MRDGARLSARRGNRRHLEEIVRWWGPLVAVGIVGWALCLVVTRYGVGVGPDSGPYEGAAHNLVGGRGVTTPFTFLSTEYGPRRAAGFRGAVPLTHFPPLFPLAVAALAPLGIGVSSAARVLNATLLGVNLVLVGLLTRQVTRSRIVSVALALLVLVGPVFGEAQGMSMTWLYVHSLAMSEPLFITWSLLALLMLSIYLRAGRTQALMGVGVFAGLGVLTRYVGISVVIAAVVVIALWGIGDRQARLRASGVVVAVSLVPSLFWALYNSIVQHASSPRSFHVHLLPVRGLLDVVEGWLIPAGWPAIVRHGVLVGAVVLIAVALVRPFGPRREVLAFRLLVIFLVAYVAVVVFTREFVDASTPFDDRILVVLQPVWYILIVGSLRQLLAARTEHQSPTIITAACIAVCAVVALQGLQPAADAIRNGAPQEPSSPTLRAVRELPAGTFIATDVPAQVFLETGRDSIIVPQRTHPVTGQRNERFAGELKELVDVVTSRRGVVVLSGGQLGAFLAYIQVATAKDFAQFPTLRVLDRSPDGGVIFGAA